MKYLYTILMIGLFACSQEVELDEMPITPVVVVDGWIEHNRFAEVFLTKGFPVLATYDSMFIFNTFLNDAKVEITDSEGDTEILTLYQDDKYFPPYVYRTIRMKGESGRSYNLKVTTGGQTLRAETVIPSLPQVTFSIEAVGDGKMNVLVEITDPPGEENFYFYRTRSLKNSLIFLTSMESAFNDFSFDGEVFLKQLHKGVSENLVNTIITTQVDSLSDNEFSINDTILVRFSSVSPASAGVLQSTFLHLQSRDNPFTIATSQIESNIVGGVGHFIGLGTVKGVVYHVSDPGLEVFEQNNHNFETED